MIIHLLVIVKERKMIIDLKFRKENIVELDVQVKPGDKVSAFAGGNGTFGTMILKFSLQEEMLEKMDHMEQWVKAVLCEQKQP